MCAALHVPHGYVNGLSAETDGYLTLPLPAACLSPNPGRDATGPPPRTATGALERVAGGPARRSGQAWADAGASSAIAEPERFENVMAPSSTATPTNAIT